METTKRKPGRPSSPQREVARIDVLMDPDLRRRIRIAAAEDDMGMGEWLKRAAERDLARRTQQAESAS